MNSNLPSYGCFAILNESIGRTLSTPVRTLGGVRSGRGQPSREKIDSTENCTPDFEKIHCSCILEGHSPTNPILSALHPQGPKSNIYVHFQVVSKQLVGVSLSKWKPPIKNVINLEVKNITKSSLALRLYFLQVTTWHCPCHFKRTLKLVM